MKKKVIEKYNITGDKVTHMKLTSISFSENETLSMYESYRFDEESTRKMLEESERMSEEYDRQKREQEYRDKDYDAIFRRMSRLSTIDLIKEIFRTF